MARLPRTREVEILVLLELFFDNCPLLLASFEDPYIGIGFGQDSVKSGAIPGSVCKQCKLRIAAKLEAISKHTVARRQCAARTGH